MNRSLLLAIWAFWGLLSSVASSVEAGAQPCVPSPADPASRQGELKNLFESVCQVEFHSNSCTDYWQKQLAHLKDPEERKDWVKKLGSCSRGERTVLEQTGASSLSCLKGLKDGAVDAIVGIPRMVYSAAKIGLECKSDVAGKRQRLALFNAFLDPAERLKIDERTVASISCPEFEQRLRRHSNEIQTARLSEYSRTKNKSVLDRPMPQTDPASGESPSVWTMARKAMDALKIRQDCYSPEAQTEMYCEMVSVVASTAISGGAVIGKLGNSGKLARLTGKSPEEIEKMAQGLRGMSAEERVARASVNGELTEAQRLSKAQDVLGRSFSAEEKAALLRAHEVGAKSGSGYGTYSRAEILEKDRILAKAGFNEVERRVLVYEGLAGQDSSNTLIASAARLELAAQKFSRGKGINQGVAAGAEAQGMWLKAAKAWESALMRRSRGSAEQRMVQDAIQRSEDFILEPTRQFVRPEQKAAYARMENLVGREQIDFERAAEAYFRAGNPKEAERLLRGSPYGNGLSTQYGQDNFVRQRLSEFAVNRQPGD